MVTFNVNTPQWPMKTEEPGISLNVKCENISRNTLLKHFKHVTLKNEKGTYMDPLGS